MFPWPSSETSSRPKQWTVLSSAAKWRHPCILLVFETPRAPTHRPQPFGWAICRYTLAERSAQIAPFGGTKKASREAGCCIPGFVSLGVGAVALLVLLARAAGAFVI